MHLGFLAKVYIIFFSGFFTAILLSLIIALCSYLIYLIRHYPVPNQPGMERAVSREVLVADSITSSVLRNEGRHGRISPNAPEMNQDVIIDPANPNPNLQIEYT